MIARTSNHAPCRLLKARYVFPVTVPPIADGTVAIEGDRIVAVGQARPGAEVVDLGNAAILPGFVNAHTHLEFSDLKKPVGTAGMGFVDWIRAVIEARRRTSPDRPRAVELGLQESVACGTTTLGEIAQLDWNPGPLWPEMPRLTVFIELITPSPDQIRRVVDGIDPLESFPWQASCGWEPGLSPHAPYSVHPELIDLAASTCAALHWPIAMHLAESREELEFLRSGGGPFLQFLSGLPNWTPDMLKPGARPMDYLRKLQPVNTALVIHGNYLDDEEIRFLADHRRTMSVVYCPRTHAYFGHDRYPLEKMLAAGAAVALGTDSRASSPDLSVLAEMRFLAAEHPIVPPGVVLRLATLAGAQALGCGDWTGSLEPGKVADLAVVSLPDRDGNDPYAMLFDSELPVASTWRRGVRCP
jgi:cytosine/adenosine deaminase-related metal-dependent hydrolase